MLHSETNLNPFKRKKESRIMNTLQLGTKHTSHFLLVNILIISVSLRPVPVFQKTEEGFGERLFEVSAFVLANNAGSIILVGIKKLQAAACRL